MLYPFNSSNKMMQFQTDQWLFHKQKKNNNNNTLTIIDHYITH